MNIYQDFEEQVKENEEKKTVKQKHETNNFFKSNVSRQNGNDNQGLSFFDKIVNFFAPDKHFLQEGQKKYIWHGKYGAFDSKFQDNREYKD